MVRGRLVSKTLAQRLELIEEAVNDSGQAEEVVQPPVEDTAKTPEPPMKQQAPRATIPKSVVIVEKPREAMINQGIQVSMSEEERTNDATAPLLIRVGVDRMSGSLFHCVLRAIYPPYMEWDRERRIRKVKEFRQDLASNFDGYYLRLDQANVTRPSLQTCKNDLESFNGALPYDYLEYLSKVINKVIVLLTVTHQGVLRAIPGTKVYGKTSQTMPVPHNRNGGQQDTKTSSPITYAKAEPVYLFILHLGGPAYELLCWRRKDRSYTLFPESHSITRLLLQVATQQ